MTLVDEVAQQLRGIHSESPDTFEAMAEAMVERFAPEPELPAFMVGHELSWIDDLDKQEYVSENVHKTVDSPDAANLISSKMKGSSKHKVILDLDFEAALLPSSTPGHHHLYLNKELTHDQMEQLLFTLHDVGIIAGGNMNQWMKFKAQFLRLPWIRKSENATKLDEGHDPKE
jgi:hypothetical protein